MRALIKAQRVSKARAVHRQPQARAQRADTPRAVLRLASRAVGIQPIADIGQHLSLIRLVHNLVLEAGVQL